jgi:hypothetical protein
MRNLSNLLLLTLFFSTVLVAQKTPPAPEPRGDHKPEPQVSAAVFGMAGFEGGNHDEN